jgi:hypothetical protein
LGQGEGDWNRGVLRAYSRRGEGGFTRRIDGSIIDVIRASVPGGDEVYVVLTGIAAGEDQCRVLLLDRTGRTLASHRVSGATPFQQHPVLARTSRERRRQLQRPIEGRASAFDFEGRSYLAIGTVGLWYPSALEVVEILPGPRLIRRAMVWNRGTLFAYAIFDGRVAVAALNNGFRQAGQGGYPIGIVLVDLREALRAAAPSEAAVAVVPGSSDPGSGYIDYLLLPEERPAQALPSVHLDRRELRTAFDAGFTYVLDLASHTLDLESRPGAIEGEPKAKLAQVRRFPQR